MSADNNYNSVSEILRYFKRLQRYATEVLVALNKATVTEDENVLIYLHNTDGDEFEYRIPSFSYLSRRMSELDRQVRNVYLVRDRDSNKDITGNYHVSEPNPIGSIGVPEQFYTRPNYFFENLLNPLLYIKVDVSQYLNNKSRQILIRRLILNTDTTDKVNYFNTVLNNRSDLVYKTVENLLVSEGIKYAVDEEIINLPPLLLQNSGFFSVLNAYPDIITNSTYNTVRRYKLNKLTYTQKNNDNVVDNKYIKEGDTLITSTGGTHYRVVAVNQTEQSVDLALVNGYDIIEIGANVLKIGTILEGNKHFQITIGYDERQIIFMKPIEPYEHTTTHDWSRGMSFNSSALFIKTPDGDVTLPDYYFSKVSDYAKLWGGISKENVLPSIFIAKPDTPVLNANNFKSFVLNSQTQNPVDLSRKLNLINRRDELEDKLNELQSKISTDNNSLENDLTLTTEQRNVIKDRLATNITRKEVVLKEILSLKLEITNEHQKTISVKKPDPKVVIDGAWDLPEPKNVFITGPQEPTHFKVKVTYLDSNGNPNPTQQIPITLNNGDVELCNVPPDKIIETFKNKKVLFDPNYVYKSKSEKAKIDQFLEHNLVAADNSDNINNQSLVNDILRSDLTFVHDNINLNDPENRAINQLPYGIPIDISSGEQIQLQVKTCISALDNVVESDWSEPVIVSAPAELLPVLNQEKTLDDKLAYYNELDNRNDDVNMLASEVLLLKEQIASLSRLVSNPTTYANIIRYTVTDSDISNKYLVLPQIPTSADSLIVFPVGGIKGIHNTDYTIIITTTGEGARMSWNGLSWDGILEAGDILEFIYLN